MDYTSPSDVATQDPGRTARADREDAAATLVIEPPSGWRPVNLAELHERRDLLYFLTWQAVRTRYVQSALGFGWAFLQPLFTMAIFTVIFSQVARIPIPGDAPYPLVAFCGILLWLYFSGTLLAASNSLVASRPILTKVYMPRLALPLSQVLAKVVDLLISLLLLGALMVGFWLAGYDVSPRPEALLVVPAMVLLSVVAVLGLSLWLSALAVQYRDVAHALGFFVQVGMYLTPVIYSTEMIPGLLRPVFGLNPMLGAITGMRAALLGPPFEYHPMLLLEGTVVAVALLISGSIYFRRVEHIFADVA